MIERSIAWVQRALEGQGYVIFGTQEEQKLGTVLQHLYAVTPETVLEHEPPVGVPGPVIVVGVATPKEFQKQSLDYFGTCDPDDALEGFFFYKAQAE